MIYTFYQMGGHWYQWTPWDKFTADLEQGLVEGEYYFWQEHKREENLEHRARGHKNFCPTCHNCLCGKKRFTCLCSRGLIYATPYRIRPRGIVDTRDLKRLNFGSRG